MITHNELFLDGTDISMKLTSNRKVTLKIQLRTWKNLLGMQMIIPIMLMIKRMEVLVAPK